MGFIMEFAENLILRMMEDPEKRDSAQREHVYRMKERSPGTPRSARPLAAATPTTTSSTATPTRDPNRNRYPW
ncbi:hypothetical protein GUJ93_ZPchr0003g18073 [Zizania palustris]|uniref:Uncharacterized protein n=1 Tax=Zizania palustris TaxID=103762 RepID=A0A8J5SKI3_ZIZPA|nr:hypothetical protein GUJ93_ZPchr0003g18073 [Zizania palustris]